MDEKKDKEIAEPNPSPAEENKKDNGKKQDAFLILFVIFFAVGWWFLRKLSGY